MATDTPEDIRNFLIKTGQIKQEETKAKAAPAAEKEE
jgi:hypothetical protein